MEVRNFAKTTFFAAWGFSFETALDRNMEMMAMWLFCSTGLLKNNRKSFFVNSKHLFGSDLLVKIE